MAIESTPLIYIDLLEMTEERRSKEFEADCSMQFSSSFLCNGTSMVRPVLPGN